MCGFSDLLDNKVTDKLLNIYANGYSFDKKTRDSISSFCTCSKPRKLEPDATFSHLIIDFVNNDEVFRKTLKIDGDKLYYSDSISESDIRTITKMAYDYYNPEINYD